MNKSDLYFNQTDNRPTTAGETIDLLREIHVWDPLEAAAEALGAARPGASP